MTAIAKPTAHTRTPARAGSRQSSIGIAGVSILAPGSLPRLQSPPKWSSSPSKKAWKPGHGRNVSTSTVLFSPTKEEHDSPRTASPEKRPKTSTRSGTATPGRMDGSTQAGARTPLRPVAPLGQPSRPRAIMPPRGNGRNTPDIASFLAANNKNREPSFNAVALDLASELGDNNINPNFGNLNALPASFTTQFEMAARMKARERERERQGSDAESDSNRMSRIMLARMTTLEEGFRDMLKEVKGLKTGESQTASRAGTHTPPNEPIKRKGKAKKKTSKKDDGDERMGSSI
jgi:hypothetical protein